MSKPLQTLALVLLPIWLGLPPPGVAETLNRCIGPGGNVSYQNSACGAGSRLDRTLDYQPDAAAQTPAESRLYRYRPGPYSFSPGARASRQSRRNPAASTASTVCQSAKERRRDQLERLGLHRSYAQLSQLDATVRSACRGL